MAPATEIPGALLDALPAAELKNVVAAEADVGHDDAAVVLFVPVQEAGRRFITRPRTAGARGEPCTAPAARPACRCPAAAQSAHDRLTST